MSEYLTLLAGNPRGGEKTWKSLYKYVIEHLHSDLAICTGDKWVTDNSLFQKLTINGYLMNQMIGTSIMKKF